MSLNQELMEKLAHYKSIRPPVKFYYLYHSWHIQQTFSLSIFTCFDLALHIKSWKTSKNETISVCCQKGRKKYAPAMEMYLLLHTHLKIVIEILFCIGNLLNNHQRIALLE